MIRKILLCLALCGSIPTAAQKITERPSFEVRTSAVTTIEKIEQTDDCTRLYVHAVSRPRTWIIQNRQTYLEDAATGKRYEPTGAEGITLDKRVFFPRSGELRYVVIYPPLPNGVKTLNWIEPGADGWKTYGISLEEADATSRREDAFRGNWLLDGRYKQWVLGVYDSVAVYDNRLWKLTQLKAGKKSCRVHLVSGDDEKKLTLRLLGDGRCRINNGEETLLCSREGSSVRNYGGIDDTSDALQPGDTVCVQGYIDGYDRRLDYATGIFYLDNEYTGEDFPVVIDIRPDGTFCSRFPLAYARQTYLLVNGARCPMFLEPGQTHTLYLDYREKPTLSDNDELIDSTEKTLYMGAASGISHLMNEAQSLYNFYIPSKGDMDNVCYLSLMAGETASLRSRMRMVDYYSEVYGYSAHAVRLLKNTILLQYASNLIPYLWFSAATNDDPNTNPVVARMDSICHELFKEIPLDDTELSECCTFSSFVYNFNRIPPLEKRVLLLTGKTLVEQSITLADSSRRWLKRVSGYDNPMLLQISECIDFISSLPRLSESEPLMAYVSYLDKHMSSPFLKKNWARMKAEVTASPLSVGRLPEGHKRDVITRITEPYKGRYLMLYFWDSYKGVCREDLERNRELHARYADNLDLKIVYVSNESMSSDCVYNYRVKHMLEGETCIRLSRADYRSLKQLFRFDAVPHKIIFDREGNVLGNSLKFDSLDSQLEEALKCEREAK